MAPACSGDGSEGSGALRRGVRFVETTEEAGILTKDSLTWGSFAADYDFDGDNDLFLGRHYGDPIFYANDGGTYRPIDIDLGSGDRHTCAWGEANGDGLPDLYCTTGADRGHGEGPNQLWLQDSAGDFRDAATRYGIEDPLGRSRGSNWIDFDLDGDLDIFVGNKHRKGSPNVMFENLGDGFEEVDVGLGSALYTISSMWSDWDVDGDPDLLVLQYPPHGAVAYENVDGRFEVTKLRGVSGRQWSSASWADLNADGRPDVALAGDRKLTILENHGDGFRRLWSHAKLVRA